MAEPSLSIRGPKDEFYNIQEDHWNYTSASGEWEDIWGTGDEAGWEFMASKGSPQEWGVIEPEVEVDDADITKRGMCIGYLDAKNGVSLNLRLSYQEAINAWPKGASLWSENCCISNAKMAGEEPLVEQERERRKGSNTGRSARAGCSPIR